jgi:ferredoxin
MTVRNVVKIDEELCDGCGDCVPACEEGAIQVIDGKARLVSDVYCDGLGACLGECPQGAITIEEREAEDFDEQAVARHLHRLERRAAPTLECGCPGSAVRTLDPAGSVARGSASDEGPSELGNWPVQIKLVPVQAPWLDGADLLIGADCVPFAYRAFHSRFLAGRTLLVGCPKLDDAHLYVEKLAEMFRLNDVHSVEVAIMEVPCCMGLEHIVQAAVRASGRQIPVKLTVVGVKGDIRGEPPGEPVHAMLGHRS